MLPNRQRATADASKRSISPRRRAPHFVHISPYVKRYMPRSHNQAAAHNRLPRHRRSPLISLSENQRMRLTELAGDVRAVCLRAIGCARLRVPLCVPLPGCALLACSQSWPFPDTRALGKADDLHSCFRVGIRHHPLPFPPSPRREIPQPDPAPAPGRAVAAR